MERCAVERGEKGHCPDSVLGVECDMDGGYVRMLF